MTQPPVNLLVVDDERNIRNNLTMVLASAGYKVDASGDGEDALTKCKERHYDIALVDIQMPKMGGLELLRYLRTLRPNLAVVILTAYGTVGSAVEAMKLGAVDFLEKPFDPKVLLLLCEEIIQRQKTATRGSVDDLLHLAELARERKAYVEARVYLKIAMMREVTRPEPYYWLGCISELEGDKRRAMQYYSLALDASQTFQPAHDTLKASRPDDTLVRQTPMSIITISHEAFGAKDVKSLAQSNNLRISGDSSFRFRARQETRGHLRRPT